MDDSETHDVLLALWSHICNWQDDVACRLCPTAGSLQRARDVAEKALARNGTPVSPDSHVPMAPVSDGFRTFVLDDAGRDVLIPQAAE